MTDAQDTVYISPEKLDELKKELVELKTVKRREVANRINEAKDLGDLSENAEYHQAREDQSFVEGRIADIENTLKHVQLVEVAKKSTGMIRVGSHIVVQRDGSHDKESYEVVGSQEADPYKNKISNESPLGQAFWGHVKGDTVTAILPNGQRVYKIISVE